jgi:uncharacterized protein
MKTTKIVIDTNLWIGYFMGKHVRSYLDKILSDPQFDLLISQKSLDELTSVLSRPKFQKYITIEQIDMLVALIRRRSNFIDVTSQIALSRDSKDDFLLALSLDGQANYLLTGDEDLLVLQKIEQTLILKIADFIALY